MSRFTKLILAPNGRTILRTDSTGDDYRELAERFALALRTNPGGFEAIINRSGLNYNLLWSSEVRGSGLITVSREGVLVSSAVLTSGLDEAGDRHALAVLCDMIQQYCAHTGAAEIHILLPEELATGRPALTVTLWLPAEGDPASAHGVRFPSALASAYFDRVLTVH
jgi:hypothetical protein